MNRDRLRLLASAAALTALIACGGALPPLERYRLRPVPAPDTLRSGTGGPLFREAIVVEPFATAGIYADPEIVYRIGELTYASYPHREWALPLSTMLADLTAEILRARSATPAKVTVGQGTAAEGLVWRGAIREFEEVDRGKQVFVAAHLEATLVRAASDSVLWVGEARVERPVPEGSKMEAVIDALSAAAAEAVSRLIAEASVPANRFAGGRR